MYGDVTDGFGEERGVGCGKDGLRHEQYEAGENLADLVRIGVVRGPSGQVREGCLGSVDMPHLQPCPGSGSHTMVTWPPLPFYSPAIDFQDKWAFAFHKIGSSHTLSTIRFQAWSLEVEPLDCIPETGD